MFTTTTTSQLILPPSDFVDTRLKPPPCVTEHGAGPFVSQPEDQLAAVPRKQFLPVRRVLVHTILASGVAVIKDLFSNLDLLFLRPRSVLAARLGNPTRVVRRCVCVCVCMHTTSDERCAPPITVYCIRARNSTGPRASWLGHHCQVVLFELLWFSVVLLLRSAEGLDRSRTPPRAVSCLGLSRREKCHGVDTSLLAWGVVLIATSLPS